MPVLRGLTTTAWWLSTCWNCQRQHQAYDSRFERRQHQSSFLEPWPLMIMRLLNNSDDVVDDDDDWKSVIMRMVTTGLAIFFQTNYSSLNPVTPSYKSPSLSTLDKRFWSSSNMKFWKYDFDLTRWSGLIFQEQCVISSAPHFFFYWVAREKMIKRMKNNFSNLKSFSILPRFLSSVAANYKTWWKTMMLRKLETTVMASRRLEIYIRTGPVQMTERNCETN